MRIGIDTHVITSARATGYFTYIAELVRALIAFDQRNQYILYAVEDHPYYQQFVYHPHVQVRYVLSLNGLLRNFVSLPRAIAQDTLDVVHLTYILPPFVRSSTVLTVHDLYYTHLRHPSLFERVLGQLTVWSIPRAEKVVTISEFTKQDIIDRCSVDPSRIAVIPLGIDGRFVPVGDRSTVLDIQQRLGIQGEYILYVGRTEDPRKNLITLIDAYARLKSQRKITEQLVLAGRHGSGTEVLCRRVRELRLVGDVLMPGIVADSDLPGLLSGAKVFVYVSSFEGFGLPVLEAMACGAPVITSNVTSLPEVAGDAALLVTPGNVDELAQAIQHLLRNASLRGQMRDPGLRQASRFSWERVAKQTLKAYEDAARIPCK